MGGCKLVTDDNSDIFTEVTQEWEEEKSEHILVFPHNIGFPLLTSE